MDRNLSQVPYPDDSEVEKMILSDAERAFKTRVWKAQNKDFLKQDREKKRLQKEAKKMDKIL